MSDSVQAGAGSSGPGLRRVAGAVAMGAGVLMGMIGLFQLRGCPLFRLNAMGHGGGGVDLRPSGEFLDSCYWFLAAPVAWAIGAYLYTGRRSIPPGGMHTVPGPDEGNPGPS